MQRTISKIDNFVSIQNKFEHFKKNETVSCAFSDHNGMKHENSSQKYDRSYKQMDKEELTFITSSHIILNTFIKKVIKKIKKIIFLEQIKMETQTL